MVEWLRLRQDKSIIFYLHLFHMLPASPRAADACSQPGCIVRAEIFCLDQSAPSLPTSPDLATTLCCARPHLRVPSPPETGISTFPPRRA
jgi:hypothetical protein